MTAIQAKDQGFTHHAKMYGFNGYVQFEDEQLNTFNAKWWITDYIVEGLIYLDSLIGFNENGFKILLGDRL